MTDITGKLISETYKQVLLINASTTNSGVDTSLVNVQTGDGTNSALQVATNAVKVAGTFAVSGAVSLDGNMHVDDKVCASAFYGDGSNITGVTATIAGNISVSNVTVGGTLHVAGITTLAGATHLKSTVTVGGAANFGSTVTVVGAAHLQSTVSTGGAATFASTVTVVGAAILKNNVSVGGTMAVAGAGTFTSKTEFKNDVSVSGRLDVATSACIGGLFRAVGNATFDGDVSVSGGLVVGGTVTIVGANLQAANAKVCASAFHGDGSNLTNISGSAISGNISVSNISAGGNLNVAGGASIVGTVTIVGANLQATNARVCASAYYGDASNLTGIVASISEGVVAALTITSSLNVGGNTSIGGTFKSTGAATFASTVTVVGAAHLQSTVSTGGAATFASTVTVVGAGTFKDDVSVSGNTVLGGTLRVAGATSLEGAVDLNSTLIVAGAVSLASTLSVGGAANFLSTVTIAGANVQAVNAKVCASAYFGDGSNLTGIAGAQITGIICVSNATLGGTLGVTGAATFASTVTVAGATHLQSTASIGGAATFASTVTVAGAVHLQSTASIGGALNVGGSATVSSSSAGTLLNLISTEGGTSGGPAIELFRNSASPATNDEIGQLYFYGEDGAGNKTEYASYNAKIGTVTSTAEDGKLELDMMLAGSLVNVVKYDLTVGSPPTVTYNSGNENIDFLWNADDGTDILFLNAGTSGVSMGGDLSIDGTTDTTSGTSGSIHTDGGLGVAKNLFVATNSTVSGTGLTSGIQYLGSVGASGGTAGELFFGGISGSINGFRIHNKDGNFLYFGNAGTTRMTIANAGTVDVVGTFTAGTKTFRIDHPLPAKTDTHYLLHSSIEGPQADLIYRGVADLVSGVATVNIDTAAGMTEGTFVVLCGNVQCFTSNEDGWTALKGSVTGNILTVTAQDDSCTDTVSWMVIGERKDAKMIESEWADDDGKLIVEALKSDHDETLS